MREEEIRILHETLKICEQGYYVRNGQRVDLKLSREEMEGAQVYLPEDVAALNGCQPPDPATAAEPCRFSCVNADSFTLARRRLQEMEGTEGEKRILVLNLANPVHPGGGVRKGARAQEEDLCRKSTLLLSLEGPQAFPYYRCNRRLNTFMGTHGIVITPKAEVFRDETCALLEETAVVSVMTCAAPMLTYGMEGMTQEEYEQMVYDRIMGMLRCAAHLGYRDLVLGAFGCGAFRNDAAVVSDLFRRAIDEFEMDGISARAMFRRIDFAVLCRYDQYNLREFERNFGGDVL